MKVSIKEKLMAALVVVALGSLPVTASLASADNPGKKADAEAAPDYLIGPEDVLEVSVWKSPELSKTVTVRPDGKISLPLVGDLQAAGLTPEELHGVIIKRLGEYQQTAVVSVIVQEVNSYRVFVNGEIAKPGVYVLKRPTTLLQAISMAGGFTQFASKNKMMLIRQKNDGVGGVEKIKVSFDDLVYRDTTSLILKPGDTIFVP